MEHRRTPSGKTLVLPLWALIFSAILCVAAAVWLISTTDASNRLFASATDPASAETVEAPAPASPTIPTLAPTPSSSTTPSPSPKPIPSPKPTPSPTPTPEPVLRNVRVGVFNSSRVSGLAGAVAGRARAAGWVVNGVANWRGNFAATTIYYPAGSKAQAELLARDLQVGNVQPSTAGMRTDRLTVIVAAS